MECKEFIGVGDSVDSECGFFDKLCAEFGVEGFGTGVLVEDSDHHSLVVVSESELGVGADEGSADSLAGVGGKAVKTGEHVGVGPVGLDDCE